MPVLLVISIVLIVIFTIADYEIERLGRPLLSKFAELMFLIAISYVVAYIFFYLTVQLKYDRQLPQRREYVSRRLGKIIYSSEFILSELKAHADILGISLDNPPSPAQLAKICGGVRPCEKFSAPPEGFPDDFDWLDAVNLVFGIIGTAKEEIIQLSADIDMELVDLLDELTDSQVNRMASLFRRRPDAHIGEWDFSAFFHTIEKIKKYKARLDAANKKNRKTGKK